MMGIPFRVELMLKSSEVEYNRLRRLKAQKASLEEIVQTRYRLRQIHNRLQEAAEVLELPRYLWYP